ncbi:MAG: cell division protein FtsI (penicillin-binding protein 3) [Rickettsiales bacterium]|jgi:cell division protein FtsI (penicillin-binding protein 3)
MIPNFIFKINSPHKHNDNIKKGRLIFIYFLILISFFLILSKMFYLAITGDKVVVNASYDPKKVIVRGDITDRNGTIIATDLKTKSLYIDKILVKNEEIVSKKISEILPEISYDKILHKITSRKSSKWVLIKKNISPKEQQLIKSLNLPGVVFENDMTRIYPHKSLFSHIVGYVDLDRKGLSGMEMQYNKKLTKGKDLKLAVDLKIQDILTREIYTSFKKNKSDAAAGIVIDVNNGEILALTSLPNFNLNQQNKASSKQKFNRITYGLYELGSILKIITNTIAFEENLIKPTDVFNIEDAIKYNEFTIKDAYKTKNEMDVREIFVYSSNIGTVKIAKKIGKKIQKEYFKKFNLLDRVKTDFPALGKTIFPKKWRDINLYTISYGHGIAITPLHIASLVAAIVNDGKYYAPSFIKKDVNNDNQKPIIKKITSEIIRSFMEDTVKYGTGKESYLENYKIGGKTGTANKAAFGRYDKSQTISSFIAAFPIDKPKYLIFVMFDNPKTKFKAGGLIAAPVVKGIIKKIITY